MTFTLKLRWFCEGWNSKCGRGSTRYGLWSNLQIEGKIGKIETRFQFLNLFRTREYTNIFTRKLIHIVEIFFWNTLLYVCL